MPDTFRHIRRDALMRSALGWVGPVSDLYPPVGEAISLPRCTTLPYRTTPANSYQLPTFLPFNQPLTNRFCGGRLIASPTRMV